DAQRNRPPGRGELQALRRRNRPHRRAGEGERRIRDRVQRQPAQPHRPRCRRGVRDPGRRGAPVPLAHRLAVPRADARHRLRAAPREAEGRTPMIRLSLFGAGRIGRIHAANAAAHPDAELRFIVDVDARAAEELARATGAQAADAATALAGGVDAVLVASSTATHLPLIEAAARAGLPVLCEKPLDLDTGRARRAVEVAGQAGIPLFVGFNRRYDPGFRRIKDEIAAGAIGRVEVVSITSCDPAPPPLDYVRRSGGLFRDMTIHDLDMARWLLGEEPVSVFASASTLVDPAIGAAGDVDTAVVVLRTASGALCQVTNSRRCAYGYDQRIEV